MSNASSVLTYIFAIRRSLRGEQLDYTEGSIPLAALMLAEPIVSLFTDDASVVSAGAQFLRIIGSGFIFYGIAMVMTQALNGSGDIRTPTTINFVCFWLFQIPFANLLSEGLHLHASGALMAIPTAEILIAFVALYYFRRGRWRHVEV